MNVCKRFTILGSTIALSFAISANATQRLIVHKPLAVRYEPFSTDQLATFSSHGFVVLEDYGPFAALEAPDGAELGPVATAANVWITVDPLARRLRIADFEVDTSSPALPSGLDPDLQISDYAGPVGLYTIQFHAPIRPEWLQALAAHGVRRLHYVEQNGYVIAAPKGLQALSSALLGGVVQYIGVLQPGYKLAAEIRRISPTDVSHWNFTALLDGGQDLAATLAQIAAIDSTAMTSAFGGGTKRSAFVGTAAQARLLARLSTVLWIEITPPVKLSDERVASLVVGNGTPAGYSTWLANQGLGTQQPVIQVIDTGIQSSSGAASCTSGAGINGGHIDLNNEAYEVSRLAGACPTCGTSIIADGYGHGTLVASIAAGNPLQRGGGLELLGATGARDNKGKGFYWDTGVFPTARLVSTKFIADNGQPCGNHDYPHFSGWSSDARIMYSAFFQNDSWNFPDTSYSAYSAEFDSIVRYGGDTGDYPANAPMTLVFSAGNSPPIAVQSPATAKNVIAVGASGFGRNNLPTGCNSSDSTSDVAIYSSRGFAPGSLIKPDLVAPGLVTGARSSTIVMLGCHGNTDPIDGTGGYYIAASGTSFSAPQVTAAAALMREIYLLQTPPSFPHNWPTNFWGSTPSPALLKATLIGSAASMHGGIDRSNQATLGWEPGTAQGWGRLSFERFFDSAYKFVANDSPSPDFLFTQPGQIKNWTLTVDDPTKETIFVVAWSDVASGADHPTNPMVNQISMYVWQGQNNYCDGNYGAQYIPPTASCSSPDTHNNVKVLRIAPGMSGTFTIQLSATQLAGKAYNEDSHVVNQDWAFFGYNIRTP